MIAIIDDDESVREATANLLRSLGYSTAIFASAEDFLRSEIRCKAACVVSDVRMPSMSGLDLQRRLKADGDRVPLVLMTAFPAPGMQERAFSNGAHRFLTKPYSEQILIDSIQSAIN